MCPTPPLRKSSKSIHKVLAQVQRGFKSGRAASFSSSASTIRPCVITSTTLRVPNSPGLCSCTGCAQAQLARTSPAAVQQPRGLVCSPQKVCAHPPPSSYCFAALHRWCPCTAAHTAPAAVQQLPLSFAHCSKSVRTLPPTAVQPCTGGGGAQAQPARTAPAAAQQPILLTAAVRIACSGCSMGALRAVCCQNTAPCSCAGCTHAQQCTQCMQQQAQAMVQCACCTS